MKVTKLWDNTLTPNNTAEEFRVRAIELSPNQNHLFVGTDQTLEVLDTYSGKVLQRLDGVHKGGITGIRVSRYGNWFATVGKDSKAVVWDGADLTPSKKFTISSKKPSILIQFNRNETHLYVVHEREIVKFFLKADKSNEKEVVRVAVKDRDILAACFIEKHGCLLAHDSANFLSTYDLESFARTGLCQKPAAANVMKHFEPGKLWIAYSNNTIGVYDISSTGEIDFSPLEKRVPFEILDIRQISDDLFAACGIASDVILLNSTGNIVCKFISIPDCVLIKNLRASIDRRLVFMGKDSQVQCYRLDQLNSEQVIDGYRFSISQLCTLTAQEFNESNDSLKQDLFVFKLAGLIRSVHFCKQSYLAVLLGEKGLSKVQLIPWKMVEHQFQKSNRRMEAENDGNEFGVEPGFVKFGDKINFNDEEEQMDGLDAYSKERQRAKDNRSKNGNTILQSQNTKGKQQTESLTRKVLKGDILDSCIIVYAGGSNLFLVQTRKIIQTDFELRVLRSWHFESDITYTEFLPNSKRKESILVCLASGEILKMTADNSFPCQLFDYKVPISYSQASKDRQKLLVVDQNMNSSLLEIKLGECQSRQISSETKVRQCGFSVTCPGLYYFLFEDKTLTFKYDDVSFSVKDMVEADERITICWNTKIMVHNPFKGEQRLIDVNFSNMFSALIKARKFKEVYQLMSETKASSKDFKRLAITALSEGARGEFISQALRLAEEPELLSLANSLDNSPAAEKIETGEPNLIRKESEITKFTKEKETLAKLQAELLAYDGKYSQAVDFLLKEKQAGTAIEILVLMGKYDSAVKILKNPIYSSTSQTSSFDLKKLIRLQAEASITRNDIPSAIELYNSIKDYEQVVKLLIQSEKTQELIVLLRSIESKTVPESLFYSSFEYFKSKGQLPFAKECLLKIGNELMLIELLIEFEQFDEAINLIERLNGKSKNFSLVERVYVAYANHLLNENKFEEALAAFLKVKDEASCAELLRKLVFVNIEFGDFALVAKLFYYIWKMERRLASVADSLIPSSSVFYRYVRHWQIFSEAPTYDEYDAMNSLVSPNKVRSVRVFSLIVNMIDQCPMLKYPLDFERDITLALELALQSQQWNILAYLTEKMAKFAKNKTGVAKYALLAHRNLAKNSGSGSLYKCLSCGIQNSAMNSMCCADCGLGLLFCQFSGTQLKMVEVQFSEELKEQITKQIDSYKLFDCKVKGRTNNKDADKWDGEAEDEEFVSLLRDALPTQSNKRTLYLSSPKDLSKLKYDRLWETEVGRLYYWVAPAESQVNTTVVCCNGCGSLFDGEVFEELGCGKTCSLCGHKQFGTFFGLNA